MFASFAFLVGALTIADVQWFEEFWALLVTLTLVGFLVAGFAMRHGEK